MPDNRRRPVPNYDNGVRWLDEQIAKYAGNDGDVYEAVLLTEERVRALLDRFYANRTPRQSKIDQYAQDRLAGRWVRKARVNPIKMSRDGEALSGEQRLRSFLVAAREIPDYVDEQYIVWNCPLDHAIVDDVNAPKTGADLAKRYNVEHARLKETIAKHMLWEEGHYSPSAYHRHEKILELNDDPLVDEALLRVYMRYTGKGKGPPTPPTLAYIYAMRELPHERHRIECFFDSFLQLDTPLGTARNEWHKFLLNRKNEARLRRINLQENIRLTGTWLLVLRSYLFYNDAKMRPKMWEDARSLPTVTPQPRARQYRRNAHATSKPVRRKSGLFDT